MRLIAFLMLAMGLFVLSDSPLQSPGWVEWWLGMALVVTAIGVLTQRRA